MKVMKICYSEYFSEYISGNAFICNAIYVLKCNSLNVILCNSLNITFYNSLNGILLMLFSECNFLKERESINVHPCLHGAL